MSDTVIKIEDLSKIYRLGEVGTGTISHDLSRWLAKKRGKEDPFALVGQLNDRTKKAQGDYVKALNDINLEVKQGEILGIIGKNGAGKSTLLKILSRITKPSTGQVKVKGRIASLLEVGTGMNPEMTGRENIYLNGTIMGMTRAEIARKFDDIIDFAGCTMYVDTPVKRYSSGMRVRLGFAVAAFLEPEILVVDEVLAVGDIEFQKTAIGKMQDVSTNDGRTVLFVSHNMASIQQLCNRGILLNNGEILFDSNIQSVVNEYIKHNVISVNPDLSNLKRSKGYGLAAKLMSVALHNSSNEQSNNLKFREPFSILLGVESYEAINNLNFGVRIESTSDVYITSSLSGDTNVFYGFNKNESRQISIQYNNLYLTPGDYKLTLSIRKGKSLVDQVPDAINFTIEEIPYEVEKIHNGAWGLIANDAVWK
ncbi:ABC transporter ATP-binding protein [Gelidibacter sp. F2691]|nr:ABC transporter ATP-binding protein [Gelidibacter sp. F2691]